jgi:predicted ATPase
MIKIVVTGTTSAGKTTLLEKLSRRMQNCVFVPEVARDLLTTNPELIHDPQFQDIVFQEQTQREIDAAVKKPAAIFCDRGALDIVAHARIFGVPVKPEWVAWAQSAYDKVLWLNKNDIPFQETPLQTRLGTIDWQHFRNELDQHIHTAIIESTVPYELLSGTVEQRISSVEKIVREYLFTIEGRVGRSPEQK